MKWLVCLLKGHLWQLGEVVIPITVYPIQRAPFTREVVLSVQQCDRCGKKERSL